jgi:REP element-mobilizing transposase RayT
MNYARRFNHDYRGTGFYFITFATDPRRPLLSEISGGCIHLKPEGAAVARAAERIPADDPAYSLRHLAVMPDHVHAILVCRGGAALHLGTLVNRFKARARQAIRGLRGDPGLRVWEPGYHDYIAFSQPVFDSFRAYVIDNPVRWQLRHDNPQWFRRQSALAHPRLPAETSWTAYGDPTLLDYPWLLPVVLSRRLEGAALAAEIAALLEQVEQGAVPIGGFISPGEIQFARALASNPRARMVYMLPWGLAGYKPHGTVATERLGTGKTLVLSGFPDSVAQVATRENCLRNNAWARAIAAAEAPPR